VENPVTVVEMADYIVSGVENVVLIAENVPEDLNFLLENLDYGYGNS